MFLGTLFIDETTGDETFYHGANVPLVYLNQKECQKMGYIYYRHECFAISRGRIIEKPVTIGGKTIYYVYVEEAGEEAEEE